MGIIKTHQGFSAHYFKLYRGNIKLKMSCRVDRRRPFASFSCARVDDKVSETGRVEWHAVTSRRFLGAWYPGSLACRSRWRGLRLVPAPHRLHPNPLCADSDDVKNADYIYTYIVSYRNFNVTELFVIQFEKVTSTSKFLFGFFTEHNFPNRRNRRGRVIKILFTISDLLKL